MPALEGLADLKIDRAGRRARRSYLRWGIVLAILLLAAFALTQAWPSIAIKFQSVEVATAPVGFLESSGGELSAAGYVVADRMSVLAFKGTGRLSRLNVVESQEVNKGELIAEVDATEQNAMIRQAEAELEDTRADVKRMNAMTAQAGTELEMMQAPLETSDAEVREFKVKLADAKRRYERDKKLAAQNAINFSVVEDQLTEISLAEAQIDTTLRRKQEAQMKMELTRAQLNTAKVSQAVSEQRISSMAARIDVLKAQLAESKIYSPFDGVVIEKAAELGEIVAPISIGGSMARGSIATIAERKTMQAEVDVAEAYIAKVKVGQRAQVLVDAFPNLPLAGKVLRILPRANRSKATVQVRVQIDEILAHKDVLPDMGLRVKFLPNDAPPGAETQIVKRLAVPKKALLAEQDKKFVWIVNKEISAKSEVTTGDEKGEAIEIKTGVKEGQMVVVKGAENLKKDGQRVRVLE